MGIGIDKCIEDAFSRLKPMPYNQSVMATECEIFVWMQTWGDTSCGHGGLAGQMITGAPTVVVIGPNQDACVYHGGRLAYKVDQVNKYFRECIDNRDLPGKRDGRGRAKLRVKTVSEHIAEKNNV